MAEELPSCFDPYLRYAITTDFKYFEFFDESAFKLFLLVEFKDAVHAAEFEQEMDEDRHEAKPGIEFGPTLSSSRYATIRAFKAAVGPPTFGSWKRHVSRVELSLPVKPTPAEKPVMRAALRDRKASNYPATPVLIGLIDDGCPFAAAHFAKFISSTATGSRLRGIWDQNRGKMPIKVVKATTSLKVEPVG